MDPDGGRRLRALIEGTNGWGYGWITTAARDSGVERKTIQAWLAGQEPSLGALALLAPHVHLSRAEMVAAYDDTPLASNLPARVREGMRLFLEAAQAEGFVGAPPIPAARPAPRSGRPSKKTVAP